MFHNVSFQILPIMAEGFLKLRLSPAETKKDLLNEVEIEEGNGVPPVPGLHMVKCRNISRPDHWIFVP